MSKTVLLVGDGARRGDVVEHARGLGLAVTEDDADPFDGVLPAGDGASVNAAAAIAEARGLPGIGTATAHSMTHKIAMRRRLADAGVPQPRFAAVRGLSERRRAIDEVGFPAVLKPANSGGQRGVFRVDSLDDVDAHLYESLSSSPTGEAILEELVAGSEMLAIVVIDAGAQRLLTLSDRHSENFGVASAHVYPSAIYGMQQDESERTAMRAISALGLRTGVALVQLIAAHDGRIVVIACAPSVPPVMVELARSAVGVDLLDLELRAAVGDPLDAEPRFAQPVAIRFLSPPPGRVIRVGPLDRLLAFPGVVHAELDVQPGDTIYPLRTAGDRRGYVIAVADTNIAALERADAAARLLDVDVA